MTTGAESNPEKIYTISQTVDAEKYNDYGELNNSCKELIKVHRVDVCRVTHGSNIQSL
jgi:hypothetical protein